LRARRAIDLRMVSNRPGSALTSASFSSWSRMRGNGRMSATRCASASAARRRSAPSGTSSSMMPRRFASSAGTWRPETIISSAGLGPIRRGRRWVPPLPGNMPIKTSGNPTLALGTAMR
jgi:hypothetical protein